MKDLAEGLKATRGNGPYRCANCGRMQGGGAMMVMVPDSVQQGDSAAEVTIACEDNKWNGAFSGWCMRCAPKQENGFARFIRRIFG